VIRYGVFLNVVSTFLIQAFAVFLLIKQVNRFFPKGNEAPAVRECPRCLSSIPLKATRCAHCTSDVPAAA
jgi:large conductance mechanosensitive channel